MTSRSILFNFLQRKHPSISNISIAKPLPQRTHRIRDLYLRRQDSEIKHIVQSGVRRRREVEEGVCPRESVLTRFQVLVLPDPPCPVDLRVVQEEVGVAGGGEEVAACLEGVSLPVGDFVLWFAHIWGGMEKLTGIAADPEVTAGVHAEVVVGEVALHFHLEAVDVGVVGDELVCRVSLSVYVRYDQRWTECEQTHS